MPIEDIGVLTIPPDWASGILENLSWLTSVNESTAAFEQRMGLRLSPRLSFELGFTLVGPRRTHFDLFFTAGGGSPLYIPLWYEIEKLTASVSIGGTVLGLDTRWTEFQNCRLAILIANEYDYEIVEIDSYDNNSLTLVSGLANNWPAGTRIYPLKKCKIETQPSGDRFADRAFKSRARFISLEPNLSNAGSNLGSYLGNYVLEIGSNDAEAMSYQYDRKMLTLDPQLGLQDIYDIAGFVDQNYSRFAKGRQQHSTLRGLLYALQGRRVPLWVPSHFSDFELVDNVEASDTTLTIKRCGFTDTGGPQENREHIVIVLRSGIITRYYRKITGSAIIGGGATESISLETPLGIAFTPADVLRISFLSFCRLSQDSVELTHHTDTKGLTTANLVFRNAKEASPPTIPPTSETPPIFDGPSYAAFLRTPPFAPANPTSLSLIADGWGLPSTGYVTSSTVDLIVLAVGFQKWGVGTVRNVDSIVTTSGLVFTLRGKHSFVDPSHANTRYHLEIWTAVAVAPLIDEEITITLDGPVGQLVSTVYAIQGALNGAPVDTIQFADSGVAGVGPSVSYTTANPYDIILRIYLGNGILNNTPTPSGWLPASFAWWSVTLHDTGLLALHNYYKRVSAVQNETVIGTDPGICCVFAIRN